MVISTINLQDVSLNIAGHEILSGMNIEFTSGVHCLLGPNGSGKTMTNRLLSLIQQVSSGSISWDGRTINPLEEQKRLDFIRNIGYMRQEPVFISRSVRENIILPLKFRSIDVSIIDAKLDEIVNRFDIDTLLDQHISTLSTGQRQKVALARTLITDPDVIILDEPTSSLDVATTRWFEKFILQIQEEDPKIIIWTTHDQFQVRRIADYLSILLDGRVLITGEATQILNNPPTETVSSYLRGELVDFSPSE